MLGIAAGIFVVVAALIALSGTIVLGLRDTLEEQRRFLSPAAETTEDLEDGMREQLRGERGYVITADPQFLAPYRHGKATADDAVERLRPLVAGDALLARQLRVIEAARTEWEAVAAQPAVAAVDRGDTASAAAIVRDLGRPRFETLLGELERLDAELEARTTDSADKLQEEERQLLLLLIVAALAAAAILAVVVAALAQWITGPVERLSRAVRVVAEGDVEHQIEVEGPLEVVSLAHDVEAMRVRIVQELEDMRRANEALEQQAPLVVSLRNLLQPRVAAPASIEVGSLFLPAEGVLAGDWFDLWALPDGRLGLVIADISGHGALAGLFALRLKDLLVSALSVSPEPGVALRWAADRLGDTGEQFATCFLAVIDVQLQMIRYANAGHLPVILALPDAIVSLLPTGPILGPFTATWETRSADLRPGSVLVAYTDGLTEARSPAGELFGATRLQEVVTRSRGGAPQEIVDRCRAALEAFAGPRLHDDVTLLAVAPAAADEAAEVGR